MSLNVNIVCSLDHAMIEGRSTPEGGIAVIEIRDHDQGATVLLYCYSADDIYRLVVAAARAADLQTAVRAKKGHDLPAGIIAEANSSPFPEVAL